MAYQGPTEEQRAQVRDACRRLLQEAASALRQPDDNFADHGRRSIAVGEEMRRVIERELVGWLTELRRSDRRGCPVSWERLAEESTVTRQAFEKKYKTDVESAAARRMAARPAATTTPVGLQPSDQDAATVAAAG